MPTRLRDRIARIVHGTIPPMSRLLHRRPCPRYLMGWLVLCLVIWLLMCCGASREFVCPQPPVNVREELQFFQRQLAVIVGAVAWHVVQAPNQLIDLPAEDASSSIDTPPRQLTVSQLLHFLVHTSIQIMQYLQVGLEQGGTFPPYSELFAPFEAIVESVSHNLAPHLVAAGGQLFYPVPLVSAIFQILLTFQAHKTLLDEEDEDEAEFTPAAELDSEWKYSSWSLFSNAYIFHAHEM
jgi:hypothetical protein